MRSRSRTTTTPSTAMTARPSERSRDSIPTGSSTPARRAKPSRRRSASAGWSSHPRYWMPSFTRSFSPIEEPRASNNTPSPTSSPAANSTATYAACEPATAAGETLSSTRSPKQLPEAAVLGVAAGLHVTVQLPDSHDEQAIREEAHHRRVELETMSDYRPASRGHPPALLLGYAQMPEPAIRAGVHELAKAVQAARARLSVPGSGERTAQRPEQS